MKYIEKHTGKNTYRKRQKLENIQSSPIFSEHVRKCWGCVQDMDMFKHVPALGSSHLTKGFPLKKQDSSMSKQHAKPTTTYMQRCEGLCEPNANDRIAIYEK